MGFTHSWSLFDAYELASLRRNFTLRYVLATLQHCPKDLQLPTRSTSRRQRQSTLDVDATTAKGRAPSPTMRVPARVAASVALLGCVALSGAAVAVSSPVQCPEWPCRALAGQAIVTRLWELTSTAHADGYTSQDVADEFQVGFQPTAEALPGFLEYIGAPLATNTSQTFFMNLFRDAGLAAAAQTGAAAFKAGGVLADKIAPVIFTEGTVRFGIEATACADGRPTYGAKYMSLRLWRMRPGATMTTQEVCDEFLHGYGPIVAGFDGFRQYVGATVRDTSTATDYAYFHNVFDTQAQADAGNAGATDFVAAGILASQIEIVSLGAAVIDFDATCASQPSRGVAEECPSTSSCRDYPDGGAFIATRLWDVTEAALYAGMSPADLAAEGGRGLSPRLWGTPGFREHYGAAVDQPYYETTVDGGGSGAAPLVFFANVFADEAAAAATTTAAQAFVSQGMLADKLAPRLFTSGAIRFSMEPGDCSDGRPDYRDKYLSIRHWRLRPGATITTAEVCDEFLRGYGPIVSAATGFRQYIGATVTSSDGEPLAFFSNVFDDGAQAIAANSGAAAFVADGVLADHIELVSAKAAYIEFDNMCTSTCDFARDFTPPDEGSGRETAMLVFLFLFMVASVVASAFAIHFHRQLSEGGPVAATTHANPLSVAGAAAGAGGAALGVGKGDGRGGGAEAKGEDAEA